MNYSFYGYFQEFDDDKGDGYLFRADSLESAKAEAVKNGCYYLECFDQGTGFDKGDMISLEDMVAVAPTTPNI